MRALSPKQEWSGEIPNQERRVCTQESKWNAEYPLMIKQMPLTKVEYMMLEEIAKKHRKKPLDYLREWIRSEHTKI